LTTKDVTDVKYGSQIEPCGTRETTGNKMNRLEAQLSGNV